MRNLREPHLCANGLAAASVPAVKMRVAPESGFRPVSYSFTEAARRHQSQSVERREVETA